MGDRLGDRIDGYAAAALELAGAEGQTATVERELYALARAVDSSSELSGALSNPRLPLEKKMALVNDLVESRVSDLTVNIVTLVVAQGRASDLAAIADRLATRAAAAEGKQLAELRTAVPLDEATITSLTAALTKATGREVEVRTIVDESLIGGVITQVGDRVIDGSIRRRLESLRAALQSR